MRNKSHWLIALGLATVLLSAIMFLQHNTKVTEQRLNKQIKQLDARTKAEQNKQVQDLQLQIKDLNTKLQSKAAAKEAARLAAVEASKTSVTQKVVNYIAPTAQAATGSDNEYKMFIYMHESGNRTTALNSIGCRGLGQACPGSKLPCGDDYACQDAWFTNYAISRYGSWYGAYAFWLSHHWW